MIKKIETQNAPLPIGPYSQAILTNKNNFLFISGQISVNQNIQEATDEIMQRLKAILNAADTDFAHVVKTTIYLIDLNNFAKVNEIYRTYFKGIENLPARETVQVSALPKGAAVEISMIAVQ